MPPEFTFFLDENLHNARRILEVLAAAGVPVERHGDHFAPGTPDEEWLPVVGQRDWVLLTCDARMRDRYSERAQVIRARMRVFYFSSNDQPSAALAQTLALALKAIGSLIETALPPFFASIQKSGRVELRGFSGGRLTP